jgi:hypothetical protein
VLRTEVLEKIKTRILFYFFIFENRAVYETKWKNAEEPERTPMTI